MSRAEALATRMRPLPSPTTARPIRGVLRVVAGSGLLLCALAASAFPATGRPSLLPVGAGENFRYWIDATTLRRQGAVVHYRLHGVGVAGPWRYASFEAEVGVHCQSMRRVEYVSTTRGPAGVQTLTGHEMQELPAGSRTAAEAATVCDLAGRLPARVASDPAPAVTEQLRAAWSGTAFAVSPSALVTNHHVVDGCTDLRVVRDGQQHAARVAASDARTDLAALVVSGTVLQPLDLDAAEQELGDLVVVLGYPLAGVLGPQLRVTTGIVSALSGIGGDRNTVQISAAVNVGNSGGPVLDAAGAVAGVVARKLDARSGVENVGFAVRGDQLREFLRTHGLLATQPLKRRTAAVVPGLAQVVRKAAPSVFMVECGRPAAS